MEVVSTRASVPAATIPAPAAAEIPTAIAQSIAASTPRIDSVIGTSIAADVPPAEVAVEQSSGEVLVDATAEPEAAQAEVTQAVQQTAIPEQAAGQSVAPPGGEGVTAAAETYRDWDDILKLARTVQDARKRGVGLLAEWNELAGKCESDPVEPPGCRDFRRGFKSGKLWSLSRQCDDLVGTYNRLAARIERADPSDFINANAIELAMADSYRALGDFCDVDIYRQKYQELWRVMRAGTIYRGLGPYWFTSTSPPYSGAP
jgi:hypothetical protein